MMALRTISGVDTLAAEALSDATIDFQSNALQIDTKGYMSTLLNIVHAMNFMESDRSLSSLLQIFRSYSSSSKGMCKPRTAVAAAIDISKTKRERISVSSGRVYLYIGGSKLHRFHGKPDKKTSKCTTGIPRDFALSHFVP